LYLKTLQFNKVYNSAVLPPDILEELILSNYIKVWIDIFGIQFTLIKPNAPSRHNK